MSSSVDSASASVTLIIPAAKDGPRPGGKPTWMLTHPQGHPVILDVLRGLDLTGVKRVIVAAKAEHIATFCGGDTEPLRHYLIKRHPPLEAKLEFHQLTVPTDSAPATIVSVLQDCKVSGPIFIKDGDGAFAHKIEPLNYVVGLQLVPGQQFEVEDLPAKSFIQHSNGFLTNIQEKRMISDIICVGGYAFDSAEEFIRAHDAARVHAQRAQQHGGEPYRLFVSHIVHHLLLREEQIFVVKFTKEFDDWKTDAAWRKYVNTQHRNITVALEGVLFQYEDPRHNTAVAGSFEASNDAYVPIDANIEYLKRIKASSRAKIFVTTHRQEWEREPTEELLKAHCVPFDVIIFGMLRCTSISVAAYGELAQHPSAVAYCVPEGSAQLGSILHLQ